MYIYPETDTIIMTLYYRDTYIFDFYNLTFRAIRGILATLFDF